MAALVAGLIAVGGAAASTGSSARSATAALAPTLVTVDPSVRGPVIRPGFLGLSFEYWALERYAGRHPGAVDPVLVQLIRNLVPGQRPVLRIGGVTTDWTWWPVPGVARPQAVSITLTRRWLEVARALAVAVDGSLIMGVNFEADSRVLVSAEARAMLSTIGRDRIAAFELGNEPELYTGFPWRHTTNGIVYGRPASWDFTTLTQDFARIAGALGSDPLAGPSMGEPRWMNVLPQFLAAEPRLALVTLHRYPLWNCPNPPGSPTYPTLPNLLSESASSGLADSIAPFVTIAHAHGVLVRNDEMNSVSCGPSHGVADVFGSGLWALDALFNMARVGIDGVNIHTAPGYTDQPFTLRRVRSRWQAFVEPEYYGLLMFAQAAPAGSRLLEVSVPGGTLRAWATRAHDGRIRVVVINVDTTHAQTISLRVPGARTATLERLRAPSVHAREGITLGGQSFGTRTDTGRLAGRAQASIIRPAGSTYTVRMPPSSAALLTLPR